MRIRFCFLAIVVLIAALLTGCGSSSKTSSSSANHSTTTTKTGTSSPAPLRQSSLRECLHKQGITLPTRKPGQNGGFFAPKGQLPSGVTRQQLNAALGKCASLARGQLERRASRLQPAAKQAFTKFATCMRANGVNFPLPNTSGKGPLFSAKGVDVRSTKFRAAEVRCRGDLLGALRAHRGSAKTPGTAGSPGSAGQAKASPTPASTVPHIKAAATPAPVTAALRHFTSCMREHGVTNFPEPEGASFNTTHVNLDRGSAQFKAAEKACNPILNAVM